MEGVVRTFVTILQAVTTTELLPRDSLLALICSILARLALDDQINTEIRMHNGVLLLGRLLTTPQLDTKVRLVYVLTGTALGALVDLGPAAGSASAFMQHGLHSWLDTA